MVAIIMFLIVLILVWIVKWLWSLPLEPDPWEKSGGEGIDCDSNDGQEICLNCLAPVEPGQHYCPNCGNVTGEYTRYMPFVNIRFNYAIYGTMWKKLEGKQSSHWRILYFVLILLTAPLMLIVGWLIVPAVKAVRQFFRGLKNGG